jgi:iron(III) transport system permease protein
MRRHIARLRESGNLACSVAASIISLIAIAPVIAIGVLALGSSGDAWPHLMANVLPVALRRALGLAGVGTLSLGEFIAAPDGANSIARMPVASRRS